MKKTVFILFIISVINIYSFEAKSDFRMEINKKTATQREEIKKSKGLTNVFVWEDKKDIAKYFYLTEKRYWIKAKRNYGYGHIAEYVAQYRYGVVTVDGKELIPPVLKGVSVLYNGKAQIKTEEDTGWVFIDGTVKWNVKNSAVENAEKSIKLTMLNDEEKLKHYKKVNIFRTVDIPITYDMEIIRGDKMQKDGGYRTGIYVEGKEKIVGKAPAFPSNYEYQERKYLKE